MRRREVQSRAQPSRTRKEAVGAAQRAEIPIHAGRRAHPRRAPFAIAFFLILGLSHPANAHSVSVCRGEVAVRGDQLEVALVIPAADLVQCVRPAPAGGAPLAWDVLDDCTLRYADHVADELVIHDEAGARLAGEFVSVTHDFADREGRDLLALRDARVTYRLAYELKRAPRYLTLQQALFTHGVMHVAQLALAVRSGDAVSSVVLSNGGEPVTVRLAAAPGAAEAVDQPAEFRELQVEVRVTAEGASAEISLPLTLLETWTLIPRRERDYLDASEQAAACAAVRELLATHNPLALDGVPVAPRITSIRVVGATGAPAARLFAGSARVLANLEFASAAAPADLRLRWTLFNGGVVVVRGALHAGGGDQPFELSTYAPELHWESARRASPGCNR